jgi:hypothetical protein
LFLSRFAPLTGIGNEVSFDENSVSCGVATVLIDVVSQETCGATATRSVGAEVEGHGSPKILGGDWENSEGDIGKSS